ncbi:MAG: hypothetical protein U5R06_16405 [candidate division KSB1 bacterium]|nr:hypothetical protein [candidate division KSB1 bacterium]
MSDEELLSLASLQAFCIINDIVSFDGIEKVKVGSFGNEPD